MSYRPRFTITPALLARVAEISALRERIQGGGVVLPWGRKLENETRARNAHASTAIEGNTLTLDQVRKLDAGGALSAGGGREQQEVRNHLAGLRWIMKHAGKKSVRHEDVLALHRVIARGVMDQGEAGRYRSMGVRMGRTIAPPPAQVENLMSDLLAWWNQQAPYVSPVLSSAILHYRFEAIHPFADGNGRTGRTLALWELYRRGFDTHHVFSVDEFFWEDRPRYYAALRAVRDAEEDLTGWLEYCAEGLVLALNRAWARIQALRSKAIAPPDLSPRQESLLRLLADHPDGVAPATLWKALGITRQAASKLLRPLVAAGLVERTGGKKTGRYRLTRDT